MYVSNAFFNGVDQYTSQFKTQNGVSREGSYHPLNWNINLSNSDNIPSSHKFPKSLLARDFFEQLLLPLEAHYGNCKQVLPTSKFTWICPSHHNPEDSLTLNTNLDTLSFESKLKGSARCWTSTMPNIPFVSFPDPRKFTCEAWGTMEGKEDQLQFTLTADLENHYQSVGEYTDSYKFGVTDIGFYLLRGTDKENESSFVEFLFNSGNLKNWQTQSSNGLFQAFIAATKSEPTPPAKTDTVPQARPELTCPEPIVCNESEPVLCPNSTITEATGFSQGSLFALGLVTGVLATVILLKNRMNQKQEVKTNPQ